MNVSVDIVPGLQKNLYRPSFNWEQLTKPWSPLCCVIARSEYGPETDFIEM